MENKEAVNRLRSMMLLQNKLKLLQQETVKTKELLSKLEEDCIHEIAIYFGDLTTNGKKMFEQYVCPICGLYVAKSGEIDCFPFKESNIIDFSNHPQKGEIINNGFLLTEEIRKSLINDGIDETLNKVYVKRKVF
ncbi:MAG: hypothetical protein RSB71_00370 [Bacilli bacterium]